MRRLRLRASVAGLMALVAVVGLGARLGLTAWDVAARPEDRIWHLWMDEETGSMILSGHGEPESFWPRYWRALLGRGWPDGYVCTCRSAAVPGRVELGAAGDNASLLAMMNAYEMPSRRASECRLTAENLRRSAESQEAEAARLDDKIRRLAKSGRVIHGGEGVRDSYLRSAAANRKRLAYYEALRAKYEEAARHPWLPVEPDPPPPGREKQAGPDGTQARPDARNASPIRGSSSTS